ncbi:MULTISPECIES: DNA-binding anti-repressor SinI [Priestia]|nr:DNA-binding anti-repressor SinI [Priestia aryabhattai]MBY0214411.1 DNA-binding anti-repressor SinI [Priestia aryabhattai]MDT0148421.1 DNA-binding anti-repressor SinI [Priestia aryabhattai]MDT0153713.1 DNA-binding anti-repressor SinI [Priestia aryabhattai]
MDNNENYETNLPQEWLELVEIAMSSAVTKEEFKRFLEEKS